MKHSNSVRLATFAVYLLFCLTSFGQQVADTNFLFKITKPVYPRGQGSVITLDEAHHNFHTLSGRYYSFGRLLENDGYRIKSGQRKFTLAYLETTKILVIANALADTGEWKLPARSAFSNNEILAVKEWVSKGGSLFLIADHMPFSGAAGSLAVSFGFNFINGFALRKDDKPEIFSRRQKTLAPNSLTMGRNKTEQIDSLVMFTGQGFIAPKNATMISKLSDDYQMLLPVIAWEFNDTTARISGQNLVNGAFMEFGKGRIVVMGEAAMFSAQLAGPEKSKTGMNAHGAEQNAQFLLNIIHWLDGKY